MATKKKTPITSGCEQSAKKKVPTRKKVPTVPSWERNKHRALVEVFEALGELNGLLLDCFGDPTNNFKLSRIGDGDDYVASFDMPQRFVDEVSFPESFKFHTMDHAEFTHNWNTLVEQLEFLVERIIERKRVEELEKRTIDKVRKLLSPEELVVLKQVRHSL